VSTRTVRVLGAGLVVGVAAGVIAGAGGAQAQTKGTALDASALGNCKVEFTLTNYTNATYYQPDWWFDQEGPAPANGSDPASFTPPWRTVPSTGTNWPFARWIGDPPLHSELAAGVPAWGSGVAYKSDAQPDGFVSTATIDISAATNPAPPPVSANGTYTVWFRINNGPQTADRVPAKSVVVTGCNTSTGSLHLGTVNFGSLGSS